MRLKTHQEAGFVAGHFGGHGVAPLKKLARPEVFQFLSGEFHAIDQNIEFAPVRIAAPVGANQFGRLPGLNFQSVTKPAAVGGMTPFASAMVAGLGVLARHAVIRFGLRLAGTDLVNRPRLQPTELGLGGGA